MYKLIAIFNFQQILLTIRRTTAVESGGKKNNKNRNDLLFARDGATAFAHVFIILFYVV